jgi:hypothetical protein
MIRVWPRPSASGFASLVRALRSTTYVVQGCYDYRKKVEVSPSLMFLGTVARPTRVSYLHCFFKPIIDRIAEQCF